MPFDHNGIKVGITEKELGKSPTYWKLNNTLQNNPSIKEIKVEIRKYFELNESENSISEFVEYC